MTVRDRLKNLEKTHTFLSGELVTSRLASSAVNKQFEADMLL